MAISSSCNNLELKKSMRSILQEKRIDLSNRNITDEDIHVVAERLMRSGTKCTELILHHNHITEQGSLKLANLLENNTSLQKLNLGYNKIGDMGVKHLVKALRKGNSTLTKLHLQSNLITESGANHLAELLSNSGSIRHLGLDYNNIADRGVHHLCVALGASTNELDDDSNIKDSASVTPSRHSVLRALYLDENNITDVGINSLADMLRVNGTIKNLALGRNDITDVGIQRLLETLIKYNTSIINLNIFSNKSITDKSVELFLELFRQPRTFKIYKLYHCGFSSHGEQMLREGAAKIEDFILLLEGDGFDSDFSLKKQRRCNASYNSNASGRIKPSYSNKSRYEDWFAQRNDYFDHKRNGDTIYSESRCINQRCNYENDGKFYPKYNTKAVMSSKACPVSENRQRESVSECATRMQNLKLSTVQSSAKENDPKPEQMSLNCPNEAKTDTAGFEKTPLSYSKPNDTRIGLNNDNGLGTDLNQTNH